MSKGMRKYVVPAVNIFAGLLLATLGYNMFLIPNDIAPGGFTGIGQLVNELVGFNVGATVLALNVPLFLLSFRSMGLRFAALSLAATIALSLLLAHPHIK